MGELGISIYPSKSSFEEMKDYVCMAADIGYSRIFTSMLEVADNADETVEQFSKIIHFANNLGMRTSIDVNPRLFQKLKVSYEDLSLFKEMGVWSIRLDEGFTGQEEAQMSINPQGLVIELNISRGQHYIDMIMDFAANRNQIIGSHNFYPQTYTGLDFNYFLETAKRYKAYNLRTAAFIDSRKGKFGPWPFANLMVSTEYQREMSVLAQVQLLKMSQVIDDIFISSTFLPKDELEAIYQSFISPLPIFEVDILPSISQIEERVILEPRHTYRGDYSGYMMRSSWTRVTYKEYDFPAHNTRYLVKGDITICNNHSGQYKGELQLVLKDRPNDGTYNVVGQIKKEDFPLLDLTKPWQTFLLKSKA